MSTSPVYGSAHPRTTLDRRAPRRVQATSSSRTAVNGRFSVANRAATTTRCDTLARGDDAVAVPTTPRHRLCVSNTAAARRRFAARTRGAAAGAAWDTAASDGDGGERRYEHPPEVYHSAPGEVVLMQFGEGMRIEELPEGTRVAYPGVRKNAPSDPKEMQRMVEHALDNPIGQPPLREKLRSLLKLKKNPKILMAFDDVSIPLPPMRAPDIRKIILEQAERRCMEEGVDPADIKFVCSIALHRFIRRDEFRHVCGAPLYDKYHPRGQMTNYNAVDLEHSVDIGTTEAGEKVMVCKDFAEADLMIYANVNYVSMDGGYKSYATGLVHYQTLRWARRTLRETLCAFFGFCFCLKKKRTLFF